MLVEFVDFMCSEFMEFFFYRKIGPVQKLDRQYLFLHFYDCMTDTEITALISLLDDEDAVIIRHVEEQIISMGDKIIPFLESEWEKSFNPVLQKRIEDLIHTLQFDRVREGLEAWNGTGCEDLLRGVYLVATYQYPDLDFEKMKDELDAIRRDAVFEFRPDSTSIEQIRQLNAVMFGMYRFSSNVKNFYAPSNSMINMVLESKRGNPVLLCTIYMLVGRALGMPLYGVNLPNLFVLTYKSEEEQFYVNVFNRGLVFTRNDIERYIERLEIPSEDNFFEPCGNKDIVLRILRNLYDAFERLGEDERVKDINALMETLMKDSHETS